MPGVRSRALERALERVGLSPQRSRHNEGPPPPNDPGEDSNATLHHTPERPRTLADSVIAKQALNRALARSPPPRPAVNKPAVDEAPSAAPQSTVPAKPPPNPHDPQLSPLRESGAKKRVMKAEAEDGTMTPSHKEEARKKREADRLKSLLASRTQRPPLMVKSPKRTQSPTPASVATAANAAAKAAAAAAISSDDDLQVDTPMLTEELSKPLTHHTGHSSDSEDLHSASERRGRTLRRSNGQPSAQELVRLIPDVAVLDSSSDSDEHLETAAHRRQSNRYVRYTRSSLKKRAEAARRASPARKRSKSNSRLQFENLQKQWQDDRQREREEVGRSRDEKNSMSKATDKDHSAHVRIAASSYRDTALRARLDEIDGMLDTVLRSSEELKLGGNTGKSGEVGSNHVPALGTALLASERPASKSPATRRKDLEGERGRESLVREREKQLERDMEMERASRHVATRLASAFGDSSNSSEPLNSSFGRDGRAKSSERARSRSPMAGSAENGRSRSPHGSPGWIARHTYASMIKARPTIPRQEEEDVCGNCEMLDTLLQQRDEKMRVLKEDLVLADAIRKKLSHSNETLEVTVDSLRKQTLHFESQLARSIELCRILKDEMSNVAHDLQDSQIAFVKQSEVVHNLKTEAEAKDMVNEMKEASWRSEVVSLQSQLVSAMRSRESADQIGEHNSQLLTKSEDEIATLRQQRKDDHHKFSEDFGRAAVREAELAKQNRRLKRELEAARLHTESKGQEVDTKSCEIATLMAAVDSYEQALKELGTERDTLEAKYKTLDTFVNSYKEALEAASTQHLALEQENNRLKTQITDLCKKVETNEAESVKSEGLSKRIQSLQQVKTVYELTINELSESSMKASQGLSEQFRKERDKLQEQTEKEHEKLQARNEEVVRQRDDLAERLRESLQVREGEGWARVQQAEESIVDLKKLVEVLEKERQKLQEARAADAVTIKVLKESCDMVQSEYEQQSKVDKDEQQRQADLEAMADCTRHECVRLRTQSNTLQETVVQLMRKQRDTFCETYKSAEKHSVSKTLNPTAMKERMDQLILRVNGMDESSTVSDKNLNSSSSEPSVMLEALQEWRRQTSVSYVDESVDHNELGMECLRSLPSSTPKKRAVSAVIKLESERHTLQTSLQECQARFSDLEEQLARKDEALFVSEEARIAAEDAKAEAEKALVECQEECRELQEVLDGYESKLRSSTRAASAEAKGHGRQLANLQKTVAALSSDNEVLANEKAELKAMLEKQERKTKTLIRESDRLQKALDWANSGMGSQKIVQHGVEPPACDNTQHLSGALRDLLEGPPGPVVAVSRAAHSTYEEAHTAQAQPIPYKNYSITPHANQIPDNSQPHTSVATEGGGFEGGGGGAARVSGHHLEITQPEGTPMHPSMHTNLSYSQLAHTSAVKEASFGLSAELVVQGGGHKVRDPRHEMSAWSQYVHYSVGHRDNVATPAVHSSHTTLYYNVDPSPIHQAEPILQPSAFIANSGLDHSFGTTIDLSSSAREFEGVGAPDVSVGSDATYVSPADGELEGIQQSRGAEVYRDRDVTRMGDATVQRLDEF